MTDSIQIRVSTGETISLDTSLLADYPTSPLFTHVTDLKQDLYELEDVDYESFQQIHAVLRGEKKETELSEKIWMLAEKYGLTCDYLHYYRMEQQKQMKMEEAQLESFLRGDIKYFSHPNLALYDSVFRSHPTIRKVQVLFDVESIYGIFICGVPLLFTRNGIPVDPTSPKYQSNILSLRSKIQLPELIHVNEHRQRIIFNHSDITEYYGEEELALMLSLGQSRKIDESKPNCASWSKQILDGLYKLSFNEEDFFTSDVDKFLDTSMKLSFNYEIDALHCHDRFQLYDDTTMRLTSQEVDNLFVILSDHPEAMMDQNPMSGQFRYHFYCDESSDTLGVHVRHQFYVNVR
ncbi:Hypothetical protein POVR1_LOCUS374 [uncultured virus]|nr:Hypothetical protein POVR1_LOCUS374 [uncultured virus]